MNFEHINTFWFASFTYIIALIIGAVLRLYIIGKFRVKTIILITLSCFIIGEIVLAYLLLFKPN